MRALLSALLTLGITAAAFAQQTVSTTDIQRLQDQIYQASTDVSRLRSSDRDLATRLEDDLDELRDEVTYLKVKLRREGTVPRRDYADVRDRIADLRSRARGENRSSTGVQNPDRTSTAGTRVNPGTTGGTYEDDRNRPGSRQGQIGSAAIPVGQEIDVRLTQQLSSDTAQVEDRFEATTVVDLYEGDNVLIPAGSVVRGVVSSVNRASRTDRKGQMTVSFDQITIRGRNYPMRGTVTQAIESEGIRGEAGRIGAGSAVGAIIGGIIGGVKGALLGVLIGGGGTIAATEGKDVTLPAGTILRVRLDTPPGIR